MGHHTGLKQQRVFLVPSVNIFFQFHSGHNLRSRWFLCLAPVALQVLPGSHLRWFSSPFSGQSMLSLGLWWELVLTCQESFVLLHPTYMHGVSCLVRLRSGAVVVACCGIKRETYCTIQRSDFTSLALWGGLIALTVSTFLGSGLILLAVKILP